MTEKICQICCQTMVKKMNYEFAITEYESGEQLCEEQSALEACQLLFLDINMQGMDGLKTAMRIKEKLPKTSGCTCDGIHELRTGWI